MNHITRIITGLAMLASSGSAAAIMITGTIDDLHGEFYQEDIWQIISDVTPDTRAAKRKLSGDDRKFVKQIGKLQKKITRLQDKAATRELKERQANRLLDLEARLLELLDSRDLLDELLQASLEDPDNAVLDDWTDDGVSGTDHRDPFPAAGVPEPATLTLLMLGLFCVGVARGKRV